jgi:hypothetical protein
MSGTLSSAPTPPGRAYHLRLIGAATATIAVIGVLVLAARSLGHPLAPWIAPTLFIASFGLIQPQQPGTPGRPLSQRLAFALVSGVIAGALLWAVTSWGR